MKKPTITGALIVSTLVCTLLSSPLLAAKKERYNEAQDLRYGVILYHFFQQAYFDALTETLVGEKHGDMPVHLASARLLRGGMSLSYGMGQQAETLFNELLAASNNDTQRDRAWFYLGKLYYLRGDREAARRALGRIGDALPETLQEEYLYTQANLALALGNIAGADAFIEELPKDSPWRAYFYFNRGARQTLQGDWQQGVVSFDVVTDIDIADADEEQLTLRDRAYMAAGYANLGGGDAEAAIDDFLQVRLDSPMVPKALLGYGWAAASQGDYQRALAPWQALSKRSLMYPSVLESLLAIPYAYEQLGAAASALEQYLYAVDVFENEIGQLESAIKEFETVPIVDLVTDEQGLGGDWISGKDYLPINPQAPYLRHLIAQDHFQATIKDLSDLVSIDEHLVDSQRRLDALAVVLSDQQKLWEQELNAADREAYRQRYQTLRNLHQQLLVQREQADQERDGRRFISEEERQLWRLAEHAEGLVNTLGEAGHDVTEETNKLRVMQGMLYWQASEEDSARRWEFRKVLHQSEELLQQAASRLASIEALGASRYTEQHASRLQDLQQRLELQRQSSSQLVQAVESQIRAMAINDLQKQRQRIFKHLAQAKLAIARLYDIGSEEVSE